MVLFPVLSFDELLFNLPCTMIYAKQLKSKNPNLGMYRIWRLIVDNNLIYLLEGQKAKENFETVLT